VTILRSRSATCDMQSARRDPVMLRSARLERESSHVTPPREQPRSLPHLVRCSRLQTKTISHSRELSADHGVTQFAGGFVVRAHHGHFGRST
jgi:hypothetical protein